MRDAELLLIVDDNVDNLKVLSGLLKREYRIRAATGGREALRLAEDEPMPDLILMDIMMPEMDGLAAAHTIRKLAAPASEVHIIALTANATRQDEAACLDAGMNGFVTKPVTRDRLVAALRGVPVHGNKERLVA